MLVLKGESQMVLLLEPSLLTSSSASIVASASPSSGDSATVRSAILLMLGLRSASIVASACPQQAIAGRLSISANVKSLKVWDSAEQAADHMLFKYLTA